MHPGITNNDIVYTERILFGERGKFDRERTDFIKNLDSVDLQAVPGSGKTTVLLAKLLILQKNQPFKDEAGILVLSHTNKAVDLIKERIGLQCPNLFQYPNFVGTIQSFVDHFLASPYFNYKFGFKISRVDTTLYQELLFDNFKTIHFSKKYDKPGTYIWNRKIGRAKSQAKQNVTSVKAECLNLIEEEVKHLYIDLKEEAICRWDTKEVILTDQENPKYKGFKKIIYEVLREGIIPYEYAYHLGTHCLNDLPSLKKILQKRYRYVFVDEMQDMETHQIEILERLFRKKQVLRHTFQRIGDNNQAIFSGIVYADATWESMNNLKKLTKSIRLSSETAKIVKPFGIKEAKIVGSNEEVNANPLPSYLIVFDDKSITNVIPYFVNLIKDYQKEGALPIDEKAKFRAIGWRKEKEGTDLALKDYFPSYNVEITSSSADLKCLEDYIFRAAKKNSVKVYHDAILDAILKILRIEKQKNTDERNFNKSTLFKFIRDHDENTVRDYYEQLLLALYKLCSICVKSDVETLKPEFLDFIESFMNKVFESRISGETKLFINETRIQEEEEETFFENNIYTDGEVSVEVGTVHSVKGETHCATLYLETYFKQGYESIRLIDQFKGDPFADARPVYKQSTKVTYVGLSRPTHLACFAAHKGRIQEHLDDLDEWGWKIEDIT